METKLTELAKTPKLYTSISLNKAKKLGQELTNFLKQNDMIIEIAGKKYVPVEGWQFIGTQLGLTDVVISCEPVAPFENEKEIKYKAVVEVINQTGTVISRGFAWCSSLESKKKGYEEYAVASMAQTRAIGKTYRNFLAWVVKMVGYEATPAEEVDKDKMENDLAKVKRDVLKAFTDAGITDSAIMMDQIEDILGKRTIDTVDEANKIINRFREEQYALDKTTN